MKILLKIITVSLFIFLLYSCKKDKIPAVKTNAIINITGITATSGGTIINEGTEDVISRGICWSTSTNPTIADSKTSDSVGPGAFTSNISGLNGATIYYVRAYATNMIGTGYGMPISFTTLGESPSLTISGAKNITTTGATINGAANPNFLSTNVTFEYGKTTSYGLSVTAAQSPISGNVKMDVSANITGLTAGTTYHYRVKAINSVGTAYSRDTTFTSTGVADYDGNIYNTVIIGTRIWMAENLKTTHYNNGSSIPFPGSDVSWVSATGGGYCVFSNQSSNLAIYGALYNWASVNTGILCPTGWHVPTSTEWLSLTDNLGGVSVAGGKMKETGLSHWTFPNIGADNSSGFTALGGSYIDYKGVFGDLGLTAYFWSSTEVSPTNAFANKLFNDNSTISQGGLVQKLCGYSVRCIKDYK